MSNSYTPGYGRVEVASEDGGVRFAGDTGDLPAGGVTILKAFAERYPLADIPEGTTLGTFPAGDPGDIDAREVGEILPAGDG